MREQRTRWRSIWARSQTWRRSTMLRPSPLSYADHAEPPTLLVHGARDTAVPADQARRLAKRLSAAGNRVAYLEVPWSEHAFDMAFNGLGHQLVLYELDRFLAWTLEHRSSNPG